MCEKFLKDKKMGLKEWRNVGILGYKFLSEFASLWELGKIERLGVLGYHLKKKSPHLATKATQNKNA